MVILNFLNFPTNHTILQSRMMSFRPFINSVYTSVIHRPFMQTRCRTSVFVMSAPCFMYYRWRLTKREKPSAFKVYYFPIIGLVHSSSYSFLKQTAERKCGLKKKTQDVVVAQVCSAVWHFSPTQEPKPSTTSSSLSLSLSLQHIYSWYCPWMRPESQVCPVWGERNSKRWR